MRKATRNYIVDLVMFVLALLEVISGFVLWLVLPRGGGYAGGRGGSGAEATFLWSRDTWLGLHNWIAVALLVIVILHLVLHWRWIVYMTRTFWAQKNNQEGLVEKE